jgi:hypothetical protein
MVMSEMNAMHNSDVPRRQLSGLEPGRIASNATPPVYSL